MMLPSHLLGTLLVGLGVSHFRQMTPRDWMLAVGFGVAIDLDHLIQIPAYVATHGLAALQPGEMLAWGGAWQGILHEPLALGIVGAAALGFRSWIPLAFWGLHMFQDFVVARHLVVFGSVTEWAIIAALLITVLGMLWIDHRGAVQRAPRFRDHVAARLGVAWMLK